MGGLLTDNRLPSIPAIGLRPRDAAKALGIGERSLWQMTKDGEIPCARLGGRLIVYPVDQLREWLKSRSANPSDVAGISNTPNTTSSGLPPEER